MARKLPKKDNTILQGKTTVFEDGQFVGDDIHIDESIEIITTKNGALVYDESPFLQNWKIDTRKKLYTVDRGTALLRSGDGEFTGAVTRVQQEVEVDKKTFVKIFSGEEFKHVYNLHAAGLRMFMVFLDIAGKSMNQAHVRCTWPMVQKLTQESDEKFSYQTFNRGMKDLIEKGYIAGALIAGEADGWYWINPDRFYNGSHVLLIKKVRLGRENKTSKARVDHAVFPGPQTKMFDREENNGGF